MAIILGAAAALRDAGGLVPLAGMAVEELILTDPLSLVVKVDVLQRVVWREIWGKGVAFVCEDISRNSEIDVCGPMGCVL